MSGGVDSTVAGRLLVDSGWEVIGITLRLHESRSESGGGALRVAAEAAHSLGIPHHVLDLRSHFANTVLEDFAGEYGRGMTPNPCVLCNAAVKFRALMEEARRLGIRAVSTGHYVRIAKRGTEGQPLLRRARDHAKDQSYVLWMLDSETLEQCVFPLGDLRKPEVRELAREQGLPGWDRDESQDVCFADEEGYAWTVARRLGEDHSLLRPGPIVDEGGMILGEHRGLVHYTVGQRRGLGVSSSDALHVKAIDPDTNTLRVCSRAGLYSTSLTADRPRLHVSAELLASGPVEVKIRYRSHPAGGWAEMRDGLLAVRFREPQWGVAPGQSVVVYRDGYLLAGGRILPEDS